MDTYKINTLEQNILVHESLKEALQIRIYHLKDKTFKKEFKRNENTIKVLQSVIAVKKVEQTLSELYHRLHNIVSINEPVSDSNIVSNIQ